MNSFFSTNFAALKHKLGNTNESHHKAKDARDTAKKTLKKLVHRRQNRKSPTLGATDSTAVSGNKTPPPSMVLGKTTKLSVPLHVDGNTLKIKLVSTDEGDLLMSSSLAQGKYGKFCIALTVEGEPLGVKKIRVKEANTRLNTQKIMKSHKTQTMSMDSANLEIEMTRITQMPSAAAKRSPIYVDGNVLMLMPCADGGDAFNLLNHGKRELTVSSASRIAVSLGLLVGGGRHLKRMHEKNIVHGDVKLQNMLCFSDSGRIDLTDFAGAKKLNSVGEAHGLCCTFGYLAPERREDIKSPYKASVDVFALGLSTLQVYSFAIMKSDPEFAREPHIFPEFASSKNFEVVRRDMMDKLLRGIESETYTDSRMTVLGRHLDLMAEDSPKMAALVGGEMLGPNSDSRGTAKQVTHVAKKLQTDEDQKRLVSLMRGIALEKGGNARTVAAMREYRQRLTTQTL